MTLFLRGARGYSGVVEMTSSPFLTLSLSLLLYVDTRTIICPSQVLEKPVRRMLVQFPRVILFHPPLFHLPAFCSTLYSAEKHSNLIQMAFPVSSLHSLISSPIPSSTLITGMQASTTLAAISILVSYTGARKARRIASDGRTGQASSGTIRLPTPG